MMADTRRRTALLVAALPLLLAGCAEQPPTESTGEDADASDSAAAVGGWTVKMHSEGLWLLDGSVTLPEDRRAQWAEIDALGEEGHASLWPDGYGRDKSPARHGAELPGGVPIYTDAWVLPRCDWQQHEPPQLRVTTRTLEGERVEDRYPLLLQGMSAEQTVEHLDALVEKWCAAADVEVSVGSYTIAADKSWTTAKFRVWNPGPELVTVRSAAWQDGRARWHPAEVRVPADGKYVDLPVRGEGGICLPDASGRKGPMALGLITATTDDGEQKQVVVGRYDGSGAALCE